MFTIWNYEGETSTVKSLILDFKTGRVKKRTGYPAEYTQSVQAYTGAWRADMT